MSDPFLLAQGWNNTAGLAKLAPQPFWLPGQYAMVNNALSGEVALLASYYALQATPGMDQSNWYSLLTQCGLSLDNKVYAAKVTVGIPKESTSGVVHANAMARYEGDGKRKLGLFWDSAILIVNIIPI
jgi:hypothetical protein